MVNAKPAETVPGTRTVTCPLDAATPNTPQGSRPAHQQDRPSRLRNRLRGRARTCQAAAGELRTRPRAERTGGRRGGGRTAHSHAPYREVNRTQRRPWQLERSRRDPVQRTPNSSTTLRGFLTAGCAMLASSCSTVHRRVLPAGGADHRPDTTGLSQRHRHRGRRPKRRDVRVSPGRL
jgi:hypothetical protein